MLVLEFDRGTLLLRGEPAEVARIAEGLPSFQLDPRVGLFRAPASAYRRTKKALSRLEVEIEDRARGYQKLDLELRLLREPFPHQAEALEAWRLAGGRGVVVLPTGSGKTFVAQLAIARTGASTLVVAPTLDLLQQWYASLRAAFATEVGLIGGGSYEPRPITVTTYDSAYLHLDRLGDQFELLVFDECHHLPGPSFSQAAELAIAPLRLGLTATPEREDGAHADLDLLIGPIVLRRDIRDLAGDYLADYETLRIRVRLDEDERRRYEAERQIYRDFVRNHRIHLGSRGGWARFLMLTGQSQEGRRALAAFREQKRIAQASPAKLKLLEELLEVHRRDRMLIFTADNRSVYTIARRLLIPAITHQTPVKERVEILAGLADGSLPCVVTSKVLNEGVNVPEANVAVILSGSGSVREHVQRLGRILRPKKNGKALLYEVVAEDTAEEFTSDRRRRHEAYR